MFLVLIDAANRLTAIIGAPSAFRGTPLVVGHRSLPCEPHFSKFRPRIRAKAFNVPDERLCLYLPGKHHFLAAIQAGTAGKT
jgi:hypothetical protein